MDIFPKRDRLAFLFRVYLDDTASAKELEELFDYIRSSKGHPVLEQQIVDTFQRIEPQEDVNQVNWDRMFHRIISPVAAEWETSGMRPKKMAMWRAVAAVLFMVMLSGAAYWYFQRSEKPGGSEISESPENPNDLPPGGDKATLTFSDGSSIMLDQVGEGWAASQGNANVTKLDGGWLSYNVPATAQTNRQTHPDIQNDISAIQYNTLSTPRGGQYRLTLSDGTQVWLNAASSIRYPTVFAGGERRVEITGEAYFEVVHDTKRPFRVYVGNEMIEDLGTKFNVNSYSDEEERVLKTTLLEGAVRVRNIVLQPGEQIVLKADQAVVVTPPDIEDVVAWKNGFFAFRNADLRSVMQKISRWYDVEVAYEPGANHKQEFSGRIDRSLTLSQILEGLKQTGANFRIEANRRVIILK